MYHFDPYNVLLSISTNIPVLLTTAFVLQGHVFKNTSLIRLLILACCPGAYALPLKAVISGPLESWGPS